MSKYNRQPVICATCGIGFAVPPSRLKAGGKLYCSRACYETSMAGVAFTPRLRTLVTCSHCQKEFELPPTKRNRSSRLFCSSRCWGLALRQPTPDAISRELLVDLYVNQRLAVTAIAKRLESTTWVVRRLLTEHEIEIRPRAARGLAAASDPLDGRHHSSRVNANARSLIWRRDHPEEAKAIAIRGYLAAQKKHGPTDIEAAMMQALDDAGLAYHFQYVVGQKFTCDFAFPEHWLIVECDGAYWHNMPSNLTRDRSKTAYLEQCGFTVMRFTDTAIRDDLPGCVLAIASHLALSAR